MYHSPFSPRSEHLHDMCPFDLISSQFVLEAPCSLCFSVHIPFQLLQDLSTSYVEFIAQWHEEVDQSGKLRSR